MAKRGIPLTEQHEAVMHAYLTNGFKKKEAMLTAGYADSTASTRSFAVFNNPNFQEELEKRLRKLNVKHGITEDRIMAELEKMAFSSMEDWTTPSLTDPSVRYIDLSDTTPEQLAAIGEYEVETYTEGRGDAAREVKRVKIKNHQKLKAIELVMRARKMFNDTLEIKGTLTLKDRILAGRRRVGEDT